MDKEFRYADLVKDFSDCPPSNSKEINKNIFRYIFENIDHENNFKPVLLIKPARINDTMFDLDDMKCKGYALSVYDTLENSRNAFAYRLKRNKNFGKNVGEYVVEIKVTEEDGLATEPSVSEINAGHFDFFEYTGVDLKNRVITIQKLVV